MENINKNLIRDEETIKEDKKNILIAEKVREVLKNKMLLTQKALSRSEIEKITFTEFTSKLNSLANTLEMMEMGDCGRLELANEYYAFMDKYANAVVIKEYEIDELLRYVKQSIMRLGIAKNKENYTCSELVKYALLMLRDRNRECYEKDDLELEKWINLFCSSDMAGFIPQNGILFTLKGYGDEYFTIKERGKKIFCMSSNGVTTVNEYIDDLNNLLIDDLFIGYITRDYKRVLTLLSKDKGYYYPVFFGEDKTPNYESRKKENATNIIPLKSALKLIGHPCLIEPLYDKKMLEYVLTELQESKGVVLVNNKGVNIPTQGDEEIPSNALSVVLRVNERNKYIELDYELVMNNDNKSSSSSSMIDCEEKNNEYVISFNDLLSIIRLKIFSGIMPDIIASQLRSDTYKYNELECIMRCIKGQCIPLSNITLGNNKNQNENNKLNL